ncbi:MAG: c-type cytochrome [Acidobacteriota bacterium]
MKARWLIIPTTALTIIGAAQALTTRAPASGTVVAEALASQANQALAPEALAKKSGCFECHSVDKNVVGPAYRDIAEKYKGNAGARAALIETVKKGGKGNWTAVTHDVPMPPHGRRLSPADITRLVDWVLSLKDDEIK